VTHPRPLHVSWDAKVIPAEDPWWRTHWPPNGWGCKCRAFALNERDLRKLGKSGPDSPPDDGTREWTDRVTGEVHQVPNGIDPGWDYTPGTTVTTRVRGELRRKARQLPGPLARSLRQDLREQPEPPPLPA